MTFMVLLKVCGPCHQQLGISVSGTLAAFSSCLVPCNSIDCAVLLCGFFHFSDYFLSFTTQAFVWVLTNSPNNLFDLATADCNLFYSGSIFNLLASSTLHHFQPPTLPQTLAFLHSVFFPWQACLLSSTCIRHHTTTLLNNSTTPQSKAPILAPTISTLLTQVSLC